MVGSFYGSVSRSVDCVISCLFPPTIQIGDGKVQQVSIGHAVSTGMVSNETLGYFIVRTYVRVCIRVLVLALTRLQMS